MFIIVRQREVPAGLTIINQGECLAVFEKTRKREFKNNIYTKLKPREINLHFNDYSDVRYETKCGFNSRIIKLKTRESHSVDETDSKMEEFVTRRTFKGDILEKMEDPTGKKTIIYKDFIDFYKLHSGQLFGFRTLMPLDIYILNKQKTEYEIEFLQRSSNEERQKFYEESWVSIVANSANVECFIIEKPLMSFLPEHIAQLFFKDLIDWIEYDRPTSVLDMNRNESIMGSIIRTNKEDDSWNNYKNQIIDKTLKASYIERNKALI